MMVTVRKNLCFTGCSFMASTRAALSSPPPAAFRPALRYRAILAGCPFKSGQHVFRLPLPWCAFPLPRACGLLFGYLWRSLPSVSPGGPVPRRSGFPSFGESVLLKRNLLVKIYLRKRKICAIKNHAAKNGARRQSPQPVRRRRAGRRPKRKMAELSSRAETGLT